MAVSNGQNPNFPRISFGNSTAIFTGGVANGTVAIMAEIGTPANGSLYVSSAGVGEIWVVLSGIWTKLTIS